MGAHDERALDLYLLLRPAGQQDHCHGVGKQRPSAVSPARLSSSKGATVQRTTAPRTAMIGLLHFPGSLRVRAIVSDCGGRLA
jgi:hypothetical protein